MRGFSFQKNTVFEWAHTVYRVQALPPDGQVLLEVIETGSLLIKTRDELLDAYAKGELSFMEQSRERSLSQHSFSRPLAELPPKTRQEVERRRCYLNAVYEAGLQGACTRQFDPLIARVAREIEDPTPPSPITLYRWNVRLAAAQDVRALVPRHDRRGSRKLRLSESVLALLEVAVTQAYQQSPSATGANIYARLVASIEKENSRRFENERLATPSLRTVYRMLGRMDAFAKSVLKDGKRAAERKFRLALSTTRVSHPLERVEIDHTPLDLFCIDSRTWLPLGRPTLTIVIDVFSRYPLGYYIGFGAPSATALIGALRHAILPKTLMKDALPKLSFFHSWPCFGVPEVIVVDNGLEFHGVDFEGVALDLGFTIQFCPKHEPRFKGTVERFLKTINYDFAHQLPGTSLARLHLRGDYDPLENAVITCDELKQIVEKWIVDVYAETTHRGTHMPPRALWEQGTLARPPQLPASVDSLQQRIGKRVERSLRHYGVELKGIRYNAPTLDPILKRYGEGAKVRVVFDPEDLGKVLVWGPDAEEPVPVPAVDSGYARGLTEYQNDFLRAQLREWGTAVADHKALLRAKAQISEQIQELMASRKLSSRKRFARLRGLDSAKPEPKPDVHTPATSRQGPNGIRPNRPPAELLPELLPRIDLKPKGGSNPC